MAGWRRCRWAAWLALAALFCQLLMPATGAVASPAAFMPAGLDTVICHHGDAVPVAPSHPHSPADCGFCVFCQGLGADAGLLAPAPPSFPAILPAASSGSRQACATSPARLAAALPPARAPPFLV